MIESRPAVPGDAEALVDLLERFYAEERYPFDRERGRDALLPLLEGAALGRVWVFEDSGRLVGYFILTLGWSIEYGGRDAFVDELFVLPSYRGRGLGKRALETMETACRELGVRALHLEVERENPAAGLYRAKGFEDHERRLMTRRFP